MKLLCDTITLNRGWLQHKDYFKDRHFAVVVDRLMEEMSELQKEVLKHRRGRTERNNKPILDCIKEEFVDVVICLEFLARNIGMSRKEFIKLINLKSEKMMKNMLNNRA